MRRKLWYIISTNDRLELPLHYAETAKDVAGWLGCKACAVFTAFARAKAEGREIVTVMGYTVERIEME